MQSAQEGGILGSQPQKSPRGSPSSALTPRNRARTVIAPSSADTLGRNSVRKNRSLTGKNASIGRVTGGLALPRNSEARAKTAPEETQ